MSAAPSRCRYEDCAERHPVAVLLTRKRTRRPSLGSRTGPGFWFCPTGALRRLVGVEERDFLLRLPLRERVPLDKIVVDSKFNLRSRLSERDLLSGLSKSIAENGLTTLLVVRRRTISRERVARLVFFNSVHLPGLVSLGGKRMRWVGIGWVDEGPEHGDEVLVVEKS